MEDAHACGVTRAGIAALLLGLCSAGCLPEKASVAPGVAPGDYLAGLPTGADQQRIVCARGKQDAFAQWYCGTHPVITGLEDVLVGVGLKDPQNPAALNFAITGHSTSLVTRHTTSLNPRVVIFTPPGMPDYLALGFARGDHIAEVAAFDPARQDINFYLIVYTKPCDPACPNSERFTAETERGWGDVSVYGDADLTNTVLDCMPCHQPGGLGTGRMLRMQEIHNPWTHWFAFGSGAASQVLQDEFLAAHPGEDYGGIPASLLDPPFVGGGANGAPVPGVFPGASCGLSNGPGGEGAFFGGSGSPALLESFVESAGFCDQPNAFEGGAIEFEGRGPTWLAIDGSAITGSMISVPHFAVDPFDPARVAGATHQYRAAMEAALPEFVPDLTRLFPESEYGDLGFHASPRAVNGTMVVQHRCGTCHDGQFPGLTRNKFDVHRFPGHLSSSERAAILWRIRLPLTDLDRMPPSQFSDLTEAQIEMIETSLNQAHP